MTDEFGHDEKMEALDGVMSVVDAVDDPEVQEAAVALRAAAVNYRAVLTERGVSEQHAALSVMGAALGFMLADG
jgi:hypothetical protein